MEKGCRGALVSLSNVSSMRDMNPEAIQDRYYFLITFWGRAFADITCRYALASLLSENNIPKMHGREHARFLVCAPASAWDYLRTQPIFGKLQQHIAIEWLENNEKFPGEHKYIRMSRGHALLTERAFRDGAKAININPDSVYPDGSISEVQRLSAWGKKVVLCTAIRFEMEGVEGELRARGKIDNDGTIVVSKREAVRIGLRHLHAESAASDWSASNFGRLHPDHGRSHFLTCCLWKSRNDDDAVIVTHNWSPFLIDFAALKFHNVGALDGRALDGNYIFENFWTDELKHLIHVVDDSDSLFLLGLTPRADMVPPNDRCWWKDAPILGQWARGYILNRTVFDPGIDELRRIIYMRPVKWHATEPTAELQQLTCRAEEILQQYATRPLPITTASLALQRAMRSAIRMIPRARRASDASS
jgi:hypothetical protein